MYKLLLSLPFTRTVTETDFILGVLACVDASRNIGKSDGVSSLSTIVVSALGSASTLVDSSCATSFTVRTLEEMAFASFSILASHTQGQQMYG